MNSELNNNILYEYSKRNKLFIEEPYLGNGIFKKDTGLCNRLFNWEVCEQINRNNDYHFELVVKDIFWPEREFIDIPNLRYIDTNLLNFSTENNILSKKKIDKSELKKMIISNNFKLKKKYDYQAVFGYNYIWDIYKNSFELLGRPIKSIALKNKNIEKLISKKMWNVVGLHIRWGYGVQKTDDQLKYVKEKSHDIPEIEKNSNNKLYEFINEEKYVDFIEKILRYRPNQIFYLSSDVGKESINHIKSEFINNIITHEDILHEILQYIVYTNKKKFEQNYQTLINIIDLFSLSYCGIFYRHPRSTWSDFVELYRDIPTINITQDYKSLLKHYFTYSYW